MYGPGAVYANRMRKREEPPLGGPSVYPSNCLTVRPSNCPTVQLFLPVSPQQHLRSRGVDFAIAEPPERLDPSSLRGERGRLKLGGIGEEPGIPIIPGRDRLTGPTER